MVGHRVAASTARVNILGYRNAVERAEMAIQESAPVWALSCESIRAVQDRGP